MLPPVQQEKSVGLREQKRRQTRYAIEDSATRLVNGRGFDAVTVEEICEDAGISRRTFFNYFESKDEAVLGAPSAAFTEDQRTRFLTHPLSPSHNLLGFVLELISEHMDGHHSDPEIYRRRQSISQDPAAALIAMSRKRAKTNELIELIERRLETHPQERALTEHSVHTEAMVIGAVVRESLWMSIANPDNHTTPLSQRLQASAQLFTTFTKGLTW